MEPRGFICNYQTQNLIDNISGKEITSKNYGYAVGYIDSGDPTLWIRPVIYGTEIEFDIVEAS